MAKSWYIISTYSGQEQSIERAINRLLEDGTIDSNVLFSVKVPMEEFSEMKNGKKVPHRRKILPGYVMLEMDLPAIGWRSVCSSIRGIHGVSGFMGANKPNERPRPMSSDEARRILQMTGEIKGEKIAPKVTREFDVGDNVQITSGPFKTFAGVVDEIYPDKNKLKINVQIFGRSTPVEVDVSQVEKV